MIWTRNPSRMVVSGLIKSVAPFGCIVWAIFRSHFWQTPANLESSFSILTNEPHEAGWTSIWPLRYWTTALPVMLSAVSLSGHVERCSIFFFFTAVESQLGWKTSEWSQLFHGGFCENHLIAGYSTEWSLDWQLRRRSWTNHNVENEEPSSWNEKLFFIKEKQPFKGGRYTLGKNWPSSKQCLLSTMPSKSV